MRLTGGLGDLPQHGIRPSRAWADQNNCAAGHRNPGFGIALPLALKWLLDGVVDELKAGLGRGVLLQKIARPAILHLKADEDTVCHRRQSASKRASASGASELGRARQSHLRLLRSIAVFSSSKIAS